MVNNSRSLNNDMREGGTDGTFKKLAPNRGGEVDDTRPQKRRYDLQQQYDFQDNVDTSL